jgi:transposase-like protein
VRGRDSKIQDFWTQFLRTMRDLGLGVTQLVISDHHRGLMTAIVSPGLPEAPWRKTWSTNPWES